MVDTHGLPILPGFRIQVNHASRMDLSQSCWWYTSDQDCTCSPIEAPVQNLVQCGDGRILTLGVHLLTVKVCRYCRVVIYPCADAFLW